MEIVQGSNATEIFNRHVKAMENCDRLEVGSAFVLPLEGYSKALLMEIAKDYSTNGLAFVVIDWPSQKLIEVQRLSDGANAKLFYRFPLTDSDIVGNEAEQTIVKLVERYLNTNLEEWLKYDSKLTTEFKAEKLISYSCIQRKLISTAVFRHSNEGATVALRSAITSLLERGTLIKMNREDIKEKYNIGSRAYKINI